MRLRRFRVEKLFGLFDHDIEFRLDGRITILHAPNGYGKTVILKLIEGFFGGSLLVFRRYEFGKISFFLDDGGVVEIKPSEDAAGLFPSEDGRRSKSYTIEWSKGGKTQHWDPSTGRVSEDILRRISPSTLDRYVPHLNRVDINRWSDREVGDLVDIKEAIARYMHFFPNSAWKHSPHPDWLEDLRGSLHCQLIETQRLMIQRKGGSERASDKEGALTPAVKSYAEDLSVAMGRALASSATLAQSLDQTFPNRLLSKMTAQGPTLSESALREKLTQLETHRARLSRVDLIEKSNDSAIFSDAEFDDPTRRILTLYVEDAFKKLSPYDEILVKIELFSELLNDRFQFKSVVIKRSSGFQIVDRRSVVLDPSSLSSGEQHELVLIYDLLFKTKKDTLLLVDEPEISLHIAWQKKFLTDLRRIIELSPMDVVLSTHSPQLIGGNLDLAVRLSGPSE